MSDVGNTDHHDVDPVEQLSPVDVVHNSPAVDAADNPPPRSTPVGDLDNEISLDNAEEAHDKNSQVTSTPGNVSNL